MLMVYFLEKKGGGCFLIRLNFQNVPGICLRLSVAINHKK